MARTTKSTRNPVAIMAHARRAATMKHRNEPKDGARNDMLDILDEMDVEYGEEDNEAELDVSGSQQ